MTFLDEIQKISQHEKFRGREVFKYTSYRLDSIVGFVTVHKCFGKDDSVTIAILPVQRDGLIRDRFPNHVYWRLMMNILLDSY